MRSDENNTKHINKTKRLTIVNIHTSQLPARLLRIQYTLPAVRPVVRQGSLERRLCLMITVLRHAVACALPQVHPQRAAAPSRSRRCAHDHRLHTASTSNLSDIFMESEATATGCLCAYSIILCSTMRKMFSNVYVRCQLFSVPVLVSASMQMLPPAVT